MELKKNGMIGAKVTEAEKNMIIKNAKSLDMGLSDYARKAMTDPRDIVNRMDKKEFLEMFFNDEK